MTETFTPQTLTSSKGKTVVTNMTDEAAYAIVGTLESAFALSLTRKPYASLSDDQVVWLHVLANEKLGFTEATPYKAPEGIDLDAELESRWNEYLAENEYFDGEKEIIEEERRKFFDRSAGNLANVFLMLANASKDLKDPKIRILCESGRELVLSISRDGGSVYVKDAKETEYNRYRGEDAPVYYGKISGGTFSPRRPIAEVVEALKKFAGDPLEEAVRYGRVTGRCCLCGRVLTDSNSIAAGIGPVCATRFGL